MLKSTPETEYKTQSQFKHAFYLFVSLTSNNLEKSQHAQQHPKAMYVSRIRLTYNLTFLYKQNYMSFQGYLLKTVLNYSDYKTNEEKDMHTVQTLQTHCRVCWTGCSAGEKPLIWTVNPEVPNWCLVTLLLGKPHYRAVQGDGSNAISMIASPLCFFKLSICSADPPEHMETKDSSAEKLKTAVTTHF